MNIVDIKQSPDPFGDLTRLLDVLHKDGPNDSSLLEEISIYKEFYPEIFKELEERFVTVLGLFYKLNEPRDLYTLLMSSIGKRHLEEFGALLTPVQASVRRAVETNQLISISAPTSAGKSYSIRDFIAECDGDAVVVVPSRALIAEYVNTMKEKFDGDKSVMISSFVDNVFTCRSPRRIFVLTPERAKDLFLYGEKLDLQVFFFDEAQISEEEQRGIIFDVLVRRVRKNFPAAKLIFAHPFVQNPGAQLSKHKFDEVSSYSRAYNYGTVGRICIFEHSNKKNYYFSPYDEKGHLIRRCLEFPSKFSDFAFNGEHSVLAYVSKSSIYNGTFLKDFKKYIADLPFVESEEAYEIIENISDILGADEDEHKSNLVSLLGKGVVIHHGSIPLEVRFLIEKFIRRGFAKICFATSTLAQGVNMPFDIVWLQNMRFLGEGDSGRSLAFKNLIGRAGRLSKNSCFDYGYVYTKSPKLFSRRVRDVYKLDEVSVIDQPIDDGGDYSELIASIKDESFNEERQLPQTKIDRLSSETVLAACRSILDSIYEAGYSIKEILSGESNKPRRSAISSYFRVIFEAAINRNMYEGEGAVFDQAISIFLQIIQGRSFREIVGTRFSYISMRDQGKRGKARFSQPASHLPNSKLENTFSIFEKGFPAKSVGYDAIVFDTYDYVDQVISFSLSDVFMVAFSLYNDRTHDQRADKFIELLRFGTNNSMHTLLMRYGFPSENVSELSSYIAAISEEDIVFKSSIDDAPLHIKELVEWYRP